MIILSLSAADPPPSLRHPEAITIIVAIITATMNREIILLLILRLLSHFIVAFSLIRSFFVLHLTFYNIGSYNGMSSLSWSELGKVISQHVNPQKEEVGAELCYAAAGVSAVQTSMAENI
jgi:hypothetical protein